MNMIKGTEPTRARQWKWRTELLVAALAALTVVLVLATTSYAAKQTPTLTTPTGTIAIAPSLAAGGVSYGNNVAFQTTLDGRVGTKARVYVTVVCEQAAGVVYQWSADRDFSFPLIQQDGLAALGRYWDPTAAASCSGSLMYKETTGKTVLLALDRVAFATVGL